MSDLYKRTVALCADLAGQSVAEFERRISGQHPHTQNGRAVAAVIFYRAGDYWSDFFDMSDPTALAIWASMFDQYQPFVTPEVAEKAVDAVHAAGVEHPAISHFLQAAERITQEGGAV
ncbi:hypothetical protein H7I53_18040 [Mycolicibacterium pulveris]|uniref:Uncharacterized protein n=1 Tax=Mycolicibacterium pulveris TaxID=36813 RepID=A0A7I7UCW4_MYCPV|nr:hypothetical protein [Mycolicibacterium pulveris]MCV6982116.1 hypothetical protein [Mycolicibacterium pulveris]BBY78930.1 hypothetical protein MPUL_00880 [Mycolicibacterium pulveris]